MREPCGIGYSCFEVFSLSSLKMYPVTPFCPAELLLKNQLVAWWGLVCILFVACPAAVAAKSLQSCPTLCDPIDGSPPGSPVPGILQARTLEWVAISFSNAWKWKNKVKSLSRVRLLATPWTAAHQAFPSMGFFRQEYWSGLPLPSPVAFPVLLLTFCLCIYFC